MGQTLIGLLQKTSSHNRPRQIAWAIVWGCVCGLIPKSSLLFPLALMVSVLLPLHLVAAMVCMLITSCVSPLLHPFLGNVGHWMFSSLGLAPVVQKLEAYPLVPWLKLHNTIVMGALFLAFVTFAPAYWIVHQFVASLYVSWLKLQAETHSEEVQFEPIAETTKSHAKSTNKPSVAAKSRSAQAVTQSASVQALSPLKSDENALPRPPIVAPDVAPRPLAAALDQFDASMSSLSSTSQSGDSRRVEGSLAEVIDSIHALENLLEKAGLDSEDSVNAQDVLARATRATELVDDILNALDSIDSESPATAIDQPTSAESKKQVVDQGRTSADSASGATTPMESSPAIQLRSMRTGVDGPMVPTEPTPGEDKHSAQPTIAIWIDPASLPRVRVDAAQIYQSHDTKISIYRRARTGETTISTSDNKPQSEKDSMPSTSDTTDQQANLAVVVPPQSSNPSTRHSTSGQASEANATIRKHDNMRHEEALRHLLDHLRALKEKV